VARQPCHRYLALHLPDEGSWHWWHGTLHPKVRVPKWRFGSNLQNL